MKIRKLLLATAGATVLLGALVSSASARNLSISNTSIRSSWNEVAFNGPFGEVVCQVTLEGSLHSRTMAKTIGTLMGYITSAVLGACQTGTATILRATLPWHVRYSGFQGTLPRITSIITHVIGAGFQIQQAGFTCLVRTEAGRPGIGTFHRNTATHELTEVGISSGEIPTSCPFVSGSLSSNSGTISLQGTTSTRISVSLI